MYKSLMMYPKRDNGKTEWAVMTAHSVSVVEKFFALMESKRFTLDDMGAVMGLHRSTIHTYRAGTAFPSLDVYLRMHRIIKMGLYKADLNWSYANVSYTPEELKFRINRLGIVNIRKGSRSGYKELGKLVNRCAYSVYSVINYGVDRSINVYASVLTWIAEQERKQKIPGRIRLYR